MLHNGERDPNIWNVYLLQNSSEIFMSEAASLARDNKIVSQAATNIMELKQQWRRKKELALVTGGL